MVLERLSIRLSLGGAVNARPEWSTLVIADGFKALRCSNRLALTRLFSMLSRRRRDILVPRPRILEDEEEERLEQHIRTDDVRAVHDVPSMNREDRHDWQEDAGVLPS